MSSQESTYSVISRFVSAGVVCSCLLFYSSIALSQHIRLYACTIGNDDPSAFMGGSSIGSGLWQSDDTARTWIQIGWKHVKCYSMDLVEKSNGKIIFQACGNGILRSTDGGVNWRMVTDWRITEVLDLCIDQKYPKNIYVATPEAIWKSNDGGDNWYEADTDIPEPRFTSRITIDPLDYKRIYAGTETGLYESKNGGLSWKKRSGSGMAVREMIVTSHGLSAWVEEDGHFSEFKNKKWLRKAILSKGWALCHYQNDLTIGGAGGIFMQDTANSVFGAPKNVHSLVTIGDNLYLGSLSGGVWKYLLSEKSEGSFERSGLDKLQVWRMRSFRIQDHN
ncbi:MAG: hypothetical protein Q8916_15115 [Bacteroidota bacterium]|nr:hypothetical protein [Bacteroidota bacterium]MDP4231728.1 hypothetical protein [Bacteroidota bacterium]